MGSGHAHADADAGALRIAGPARVVVLVLIALAGVAAVAGVVRWWPDGQRLHRAEGLVPVAAAGVRLVHGQLLEVRTACGSEGPVRHPPCGDSAARVLDGASAGRTARLQLTPDVVGTGLKPGDRVLLLDLTHAQGGSGGFAFYRADRGTPLLWLGILFALAVVLVVRLRGLLALISLGFGGLVVVGFLVPALLSGRPAVPTTLAAAVLILIVILYATHGLSMRTSVALLGALAGVGLSALFAWLGVVGTRLGGLGDDPAALLTVNAGWVDVQQLVVASVVLAGLGTLNDVTVTQASALWELRTASPDASPTQLYRRAMRIGRDHVASNVYTIAFAYTGTALVLLVAVQLYRGTPWDFVTSEDVAEEIVRTLVGGIALVLAMPLTTAVAVLVAGSAEVEAPLTRHR